MLHASRECSEWALFNNVPCGLVAIMCYIFIQENKSNIDENNMVDGNVESDNSVCVTTL